MEALKRPQIHSATRQREASSDVFRQAQAQHLTYLLFSRDLPPRTPRLYLKPLRLRFCKAPCTTHVGYTWGIARQLTVGPEWPCSLALLGRLP